MLPTMRTPLIEVSYLIEVSFYHQGSLVSFKSLPSVEIPINLTLAQKGAPNFIMFGAGP